MAARQGRLFVKKSDEGGADKVYDGAMKSAFDGGNKRDPAWEARKPRFTDPTPGPEGYEAVKSDFSDASRGGRPSPMMQVPGKQKARSDDWIANPEQVNSPPPGPLPGNIGEAKGGGSWSKSSTGGDRFSKQHAVASYGDSGNAPLSGFQDAVAHAKPSPSVLAGGDRFKKAYDVPSYGDPGALASQVDVEKREREARLVRQQQQAAIAAERDHAKYQ